MFKNYTNFFIFILTCTAFSVKASIKNETSCSPDLDCNPVTQGRVIFVSGSCSSGKSSIAKIITQKLNAKFFAFDEYVMPLILKKFITKHYGRVLSFFISSFVMRNFFSAVNFLSEKRKYILQKKFYADLKDGMGIEPTSRMFREVKQLALQGKNVVVEAPLYLWDGVDCLKSLAEFNGVSVTYVLTYCPWADLIERINLRNSHKNTKNKRELNWVVINYIDTFKVISNYQGAGFLEYVNGKDVHRVIKEYSKSQYKKGGMHLLTETQNVAFQAFSKESHYYIYPRFNYNITVDTKVNSPEQGAALVLNYLQKNNHRRHSFLIKS